MDFGVPGSGRFVTAYCAGAVGFLDSDSPLVVCDQV